MLAPTNPPGHADRIRALLASAGPPAPAPLAIHADPQAVVVTPSGDLDVATAPTLDADLKALRDVGFETIVLDLRELDFIDSAGVHLLLRWARSAALRGHEFRILPGADRVQLVLRLTGVLASLGLEGPRRAA